MRRFDRFLAMVFLAWFAGGVAMTRAQSALNGFDPNANGPVRAMVVQPDGKILVAGKFFSLGGFGHVDYLARLDPVTGTADSFKPNANGVVRALALQADGKVLAGGVFSIVGGQSRNLFARLANDTAALTDLVVTRTSITPVRFRGFGDHRIVMR